MKKRILMCFGTRPEWIKIKPLVLEFDTDTFDIYFTGQHTTLVDFDELKGLCEAKGAELFMQMDNPATVLLNNRLDTVIVNCIGAMESIDFSKYAGVLVQGDTASAFACALAAFNRKVPVIHLEAGLRTRDLKQPYPEEGYRQMISRITTIHLAPTELSLNNLVEERLPGKMFVVGNTVLDSVRKILEENGVSVSYNGKVLVTLHRRENHGIIDQWFDEIEHLATTYPALEFILPIHPNPEVKKHVDKLKNVKVCEPLSHVELVKLMASCHLIITDSGGIQEEATFLNKKTIVCRESTERPEGIASGHLFMCQVPDELPALFGNLIKDVYIVNECPYGDGYSASRIRTILELLNWNDMKNFTNDFYKFTDMIRRGENFALSRFSDGEMYILQGTELKLAEGLVQIGDVHNHGNFYKQIDAKHFDPKIHEGTRNHLIRALQHKQHNYFKGISCPCCVGKENFDWQVNLHGGDDDSLTWANIWVNGNYHPFIKITLPLFFNRKCVFVGHKDADISMFQFFVKDFRVGYNAMVNDIPKIDEIKEWIKTNNIENHLFLFSASTFSNLAIYELYKEFPNNTYIDIGTTLSPMTSNVYERDYLSSFWNYTDHPILHQVCQWG